MTPTRSATRPFATGALALALSAALGGAAFAPAPVQAKTPAASTRRHPVRELHPAQRPARDRAHRPQGADRRGQHLVPRRQQGRAAGPQRLRAPVRAPDVQRLGKPQGRILRAASKLVGATDHERHHQLRPHQLLPERADHRARHGAVDGIRPHGPPARRDRPDDARRAARRGAEREAPGREPALRPGAGKCCSKALYPAGHPYHHTTIGSMADLNAASLDDVKNWFRSWYGPNNAVLVLAGDIDVATAKEKVARYFGDIPASADDGAAEGRCRPSARRPRARRWPTRCRRRASTASGTSPQYGAADVDRLQLLAQVLGGSKSSRLDKRLLFDDKLVDSVSARRRRLAAGFELPHPADVKQGVDPAKVESGHRRGTASACSREGPTAAELEQARTVFKAGFVRGIERIGGFGGKADALAECAVYTGNPGCFRDSLKTHRDRVGRRHPEGAARSGSRRATTRSSCSRARARTCRKIRRARRRRSSCRRPIRSTRPPRARSIAARACRSPTTSRRSSSRRCSARR